MGPFAKKRKFPKRVPRTGREEIEEWYRGSPVHRAMNTKIWFYAVVFLLVILMLMMLAPAAVLEDFDFTFLYLKNLFARLFGK